MERIEIEEAKGLIKADSSNDNSDAHYFTLTPALDGWEKVTYYTNRKSTYNIPTSVPNAQWVYILSNEAMPNIVKIGYTNNDPHERVKEINRATGVPSDFIVEYALPCVNGYEVEQLVHEYLEDEGLRVNTRKEFFQMDIEDAIVIIERIGKPYKIIEDELNN
jgi:hypothetical protein